LADHQYKHLLSIPLVMGFINATRALSLVLGQFILSRHINPKTLFYLLLAQGLSIMVWGVLQFNFYISFTWHYFMWTLYNDIMVLYVYSPAV